MAKIEGVGCAEEGCASEAYGECFFCEKNLCYSHGGTDSGGWLILHTRQVLICLKDRDRRVGDILTDPRTAQWLQEARLDDIRRGVWDRRK